MKLLIAGGTGFIGRHLTQALLEEGACVTILGRDASKIEHLFASQAQAVTWNDLSRLDPNQFDAIINLTGENIGDKRWSSKVKQMIVASRTHATESILEWCRRLNKPMLLYNASAIGIYGLKQDNPHAHPFTEDTTISWGQPSDFLSEVGQAWEKASRVYQNPLLHIVHLRFAPVLYQDGGVLGKMLPLFRFGLGGPIGRGKQAFSWVHLEDAIRAIQFLLRKKEVIGPVNICSPHWVTQGEFAKTLGNVLHRPAILPMPAWFLKIIFGQMAEELLLSGQAVIPRRLMDLQFQFLYPTLLQALQREKL